MGPLNLAMSDRRVPPPRARSVTLRQCGRASKERRMQAHQPSDHERERRIALLARRLPGWMQSSVHWLRRPRARWVRIPAGLALIAGGFLAILPIFGLWMLPLGVILLAEDMPPLRRLTDRALAWIEHRRPHWMGLPERG
jgi:hypothetical protein